MVGIGMELEIARPGWVRTAIWALFPLIGACGDDGGAGGTGSASDTGSTSSTASSSTDASTTQGGSSSTSVGSADTSSSGSSSSQGSATESTSDTEAGGCWDDEFSGYYSESPDWEAFECPSLPIPCPEAAVSLITGVDDLEPDMTPEEIAAADAAARCILEALRDGTSGAFTVSWSEESGQNAATTRYFVLDTGVVASFSAVLDLGASAVQAFRAPREAAYFDGCLAETELVPLMRCIAVLPESYDVADIPAIDSVACIDGAPQCG